MLIIQDKLISDDVVSEQFLCNLSACKGACCWEGDSGAPLEEAERAILDQIYDKIKPFLSKESQQVLEEEGKYTYYKKPGEYGTPLLNNAACAYMTYTESGVAQCGIEQAYKAGLTDFKKPISCHLYPIRVTENKESAFEALNYDRWDICSAACTLGKEQQLPVYQFLKEALIRKYGTAFYEELDHAAQYLKDKE